MESTLAYGQEPKSKNKSKFIDPSTVGTKVGAIVGAMVVVGASVGAAVAGVGSIVLKLVRQ